MKSNYVQTVNLVLRIGVSRLIFGWVVSKLRPLVLSVRLDFLFSISLVIIKVLWFLFRFLFQLLGMSVMGLVVWILVVGYSVVWKFEKSF